VLTFVVENAGNTPEEVAMVVVELPEGLSLSGWGGTATVAPGAQLALTVRVEGAEGASAGFRNLTLEVRPAAGTPFPPKTLEVQVEVRPAAAAAQPFLPGDSAASAVSALALCVGVGARLRRRS
jgi:hypothetical protein